MQKRWFIKTPPTVEQKSAIQEELKLSALMAEVLAQKGLTSQQEIRSYFNPDLESLHDPFMMLNMDKAVDRLMRAIENQEHIVVYGDYDVDGTTAVALMYSVLKSYTNVSFYIPDRYEEGYGLSRLGIETAVERGAGLLVALDCGIKEIETVNYANSLGLEIIICDHHTPGEEIPACIVLDPKQEDCQYPYKELCGCGVGFKLLHALFIRRKEDTAELFKYLDLVAIAIGADIVPVTGENRLLCKRGMQILNENPRRGIEALVEIAEKKFPLSLTNVVFIIAPRINAAGRLKSGSRAVELLITEDPKVAKAIAAEINEYNKERRELDAQITQEALALIARDSNFSKRKSTVVFQNDWHKGVVGIVASRLIEHHYRPTIVLTESKGKITGSARTAGNFNVYEAILACDHLLEQFGGHQHAAGLTLDSSNLEAFKEAFEVEVGKRMTAEHESEELTIDHEVSFSDLFLSGESVYHVPRLVKMQEQMEPFGPHNQQPVFCIRSVYAQNFRVLKDAHLKIDILDSVSGITLPAIAFNMADKADLLAPGCAFDCVFTLETNTWNDRTTLQLQVRDLRETI